MVFSTPFFLFFYLPIVLAIYCITPLKFRNLMLLIANLIFYGWGEPVYILIMFVSIGIDYTHGLLVEKGQKTGNTKLAKGAVASSVICNLALLFFFKYWDFVAESLAAIGLTFMPHLGLSLPIGISFYTFQTMSYTIDVYRGDARPQRNIITFGTFVTLFPQLIAGPILQYKDLDDQLRVRDHTVEKFARGVEIFVIGLAKKVLLANSLGQLWDAYKAMPTAQLSVVGAWVGAIAAALQLYFDFSGYSDMAIGLGRMLGFEFLKNFDHPFVSKSISEFWRRWHISLGSWFREYLYFPLGGSRVSTRRMCLNLLIVWAATGIWHGASWNFLIWGLFFGVFITMEKLFLLNWLEKLPKFFQHAYVIVLTMFSFAIFSIEDFSQLFPYLGAMLGFAGGGVMDSATRYYLRSNALLLLITFVASTTLGVKVYRKLGEKAKKIVTPVLILLGLVFCTAYLVDATYNPFLYFRF